MIMVSGIEDVSVVAGDAISLEYSRLSLHIRDLINTDFSEFVLKRARLPIASRIPLLPS